MKVECFGLRLKIDVPLPKVQLVLSLMVLVGSVPARPQHAPAASDPTAASCASPPCPQPAKAPPKPSPANKQAPVTPPPQTASPKGLDIVMTCAINTGICISANSKFQLPVYKAPICPVLDTALKDPKTSGMPDSLQASVANFVATSVMQQPPLSVTAIDNLLVISSADPNPAKYDPPPSKGAASQNPPSNLTPLHALEQEITQLLALLNQDPKLVPPVSVELVFPSALVSDGEFQAALGTNFTLQRLTGSKVIVSGASTNLLTCGQWENFLRQAGAIAQADVQVLPVYRTYEIHAGDAVNALNMTSVDSAGGAKAGGGSRPAPAASSPAADQSSGGAPIAAAPAAAAAPVAGSAATAAAAPPAATPATPPAAPPTAPPAATPPASATNFPPGDPGDDLAIFNGSGGDVGILEKQRILAAMDLPRPQMIINGSVLQSSTKDLTHSVKFRNSVTEFVNEQNDALQQAIVIGWQVVRQRIADGSGTAPVRPFFDRDFIDYLTERKAYKPLLEGHPSPDAIGQLLGGTGSVGSEPNLKFCAVDRYCLGYTELFLHPEPRLTDLMLTFIAAQSPSVEASSAIDCVEFWNPGNPSAACAPALPQQTEGQKRLADGLGVRPLYATMQTQAGWPRPVEPCEQLDLAGVVAYTQTGAQPHLFLECFRRAMDALVKTIPPLNSDATPSAAPVASALGPVRASLADFLFNYKMSQMYPHEFTAYDLTQSAVVLDQSLEVLIDAFNRDLAAYQMYWQVRFDQEATTIGKIDLFYGGVISVRTVSGNVSSASSTTQSFLNISSAPQIGTVLAGLVGAASASSPIGVLSNLSGNQAQTLTAALQSYQTTKAQIGRSLSVQVQPRSLAGASAAEMDVTFNVDESAPPTYWSNPPTNNTSGPDLSRVASHNITTHVRVDSLNLFEISSMTAILRAGRTKFPLLPPFVEIPYIGTLVGIPLRDAKSYHTSTAILSAVVVPTASDLASSLRFRSDLVLIPLEPTMAGATACSLSFHTEPGASLPQGPVCHVRRATSMEDLGGRSRLIEFNRQMVECYANGYSNCYSLTFDKILAPHE
jgi:hypothetical protein